MLTEVGDHLLWAQSTVWNCVQKIDYRSNLHRTVFWKTVFWKIVFWKCQKKGLSKDGLAQVGKYCKQFDNLFLERNTMCVPSGTYFQQSFFFHHSREFKTTVKQLKANKDKHKTNSNNLRQLKARTNIYIYIYIYMFFCILLGWPFFENVFSPEGWPKNHPIWILVSVKYHIEVLDA